MRIDTSYYVKTAKQKQKQLISYAMQDKFFADRIYDLTDFGYEINFSFLGGAGAYIPFALSTEIIDTQEKQQQFASGFWSMVEGGDIKAQMLFFSLLGADINDHYFLHEIMHFYQDMHGLYLLPLQEKGVFPVMLDVTSDIVALMFCEAWAEVEAIRTSWSLREKGDDSGWRGAITSPDWSLLAQKYDDDLQGGVDESKAAANTFHRWYEGAHRSFYEHHALKIYESNLARYRDGAGVVSDNDISQNLRKLELPMLLARLPKGGIPKFFHQIDWEDELYNNIKTHSVLAHIKVLTDRYGVADNPNIQEIKCGAPPYLWHRLRMAEQETSEVPPY